MARNLQGRTALWLEALDTNETPARSARTFPLEGMPSRYPPHTHTIAAEDPLLLNDLSLLAEFLWPPILFLSHSVQLHWSPSVTVATSRWGSLTRVSGRGCLGREGRGAK